MPATASLMAASTLSRSTWSGARTVMATTHPSEAVVTWLTTHSSGQLISAGSRLWPLMGRSVTTTTDRTEAVGGACPGCAPRCGRHASAVGRSGAHPCLAGRHDGCGEITLMIFVTSPCASNICSHPSIHDLIRRKAHPVPHSPEQVATDEPPGFPQGPCDRDNCPLTNPRSWVCDQQLVLPLPET